MPPIDTSSACASASRASTRAIETSDSVCTRGYLRRSNVVSLSKRTLSHPVSDGARERLKPGTRAGARGSEKAQLTPFRARRGALEAGGREPQAPDRARTRVRARQQRQARVGQIARLRGGVVERLGARSAHAVQVRDDQRHAARAAPLARERGADPLR